MVELMRFSRFFVTALLVITGLLMPVTAFAQSCDFAGNCGDPGECETKWIVCKRDYDLSVSATKPHIETLKKMEASIQAFQNRIKLLELDLIKKAAAIAQAENDLSNVLALASRRIAALYRRTQTYNPLLPFLTSTNVGAVLRAFTYQHVVIDADKKSIAQTAVSIRDLEARKSALEKEKITLGSLKEDMDKRAESVRKLIAESTAYQAKLSSAIAALSAKQQSFLAAKLSGLNLPTSLGAGPLYCTDDRKLDPGFSPAFAVFTFGIPHRIGLNQYGALGRAKDGQTYQNILRAYFDGINFEKRDSHMKIKVQGYGEMDLDQYMLGIYEMPGDWPIEALKAQVVAARSYALAYTDNGAKEICTTQSCQVYKGGNKGGNWESAVKQTEGEVMTNGGQVITAWYSSTDGGYTYKSGDVGWSDRPWTKRVRDTTGDIGSFSDLLSRGYDRDSPCFYAAQGFRSQYGKSAWLKSEEVADIVNVIALARKDSGTKEHLYQPDKPNPAGTDTWDRDKVKTELKSRGGTPFNSVSQVSATGVDWGVGRTTGITVTGDAGSVTFEGAEFKDFFNLRAPANIQIVGPLFNIERK